MLDRRGEKISTQHILRIVDFSDDDRVDTYNSISDIYNKTNNNPSTFDSLSNIFLTKYKNNSGKYLGFPVSRIPDYVFDVLKYMSPGKLSLPVEMDGGYFLVYYYDHQKELIPNLDNSWDLIYQYAKQEKQSSTFEALIKDVKKNIYINVLNN